MKFFSIILTFLFFFLSTAFSEIEDCSEFNKLSKEYLKCTKNNLKQKSNDSGLTNKVENFKSSKTLTEFFKKNRGEK
tara:strand:- start:465 stop:695 length:231 start_codon:yes stop_codon:yes gene_type:complete